MRPPRIDVVMDCPPGDRYHDATMDAIAAAADSARVEIDARWQPTAGLVPAADREGVVIGPGGPYDDLDAVIATIADARARGIPLLGT